MSKKGVIGEVMITFIATIVIVIILIIFSLVSATLKTVSGSKDRVDKFLLTTGESGSYSSEFGKLTNFRFFLSEAGADGKNLRGFDDAYDLAFGPVITIWTPAPSYAQFPDTCYYYKYLSKKTIWVVSDTHGESWMGLDEVIGQSLPIAPIATSLKNKNFEQGRDYLYSLQAQKGCK